ncbi:MAG TPA: hypothetical protein VLT58_09005 [Polyangia bacterium]|nr:hypothetical protein [Polyangia bacterium]
MNRSPKQSAKRGLRAVIVVVLASLLGAVSCDQDVPLGADPGRDAAPADAGATD